MWIWVLLCGYQLAPMVPAHSPVTDMNQTPKLIKTDVSLQDGNEDITGVWGAQCSFSDTHVDGARF